MKRGLSTPLARCHSISQRRRHHVVTNLACTDVSRIQSFVRPEIEQSVKVRVWSRSALPEQQGLRLTEYVQTLSYEKLGYGAIMLATIYKYKHTTTTA